MDTDKKDHDSELPGAPAPGPVVSPEPEAPAPAPAAAPVAPVGAKPPVNAGLIVLQWLTYAFWGWTVLSLSILTTLVLNHFLNDSDSAGFMPYGIAAIMVLLPISFICDSFYSKKEPEHKVGAEVWVMVFHAVIFALFGIGALIAAVIALVMLVTNGFSSVPTQVALYSALIITVYYGLTFLRTLNPAQIRKFTKWYKMVMLVTVGVIALLGIVGPLAKERASRNDRLVVAQISTIQNNIEGYAQKNKRLPDNLNALDLRVDAKQVVDEKLVTYKPEGLYEDLQSPNSGGVNIMKPVLTQARTSTGPDEYRYQLCTTYTNESNDYGGYSKPAYGPEEDSDYATYISAHTHPKGDVCYKLKVDVY